MNLSVILPVYLKDRPDYLDLAIESIWSKQTYKPDEVILIQDGPLTTDLKKIISKWINIIGGSLKIIELEKNHGLAHALNIGIQQAKSKYIARMDADDISLPMRFDRQMGFLYMHPEVDILGSWAQDIDAEGKELSVRKVPAKHSEIVKYIWTCPLIHPTVIFRKSAIQKVGLYNASIKRRQDYELWFRCVNQGLCFANIPSQLLLYRYTEDWFAKNNAKVIWQQVNMGWKGCKLVGAAPIAYIGTAFPLIKLILPNKLGLRLTDYFKRIDPRDKTA